MLSAVSFMVVIATAALLGVVAWRHYEWRGGFCAIACVLVAAAINSFDWDCKCQWLPVIGSEPEVFFIGMAILGGAAIAWFQRGTTLVAFGAILHNRRLPLLIWGLLLVTILPNVAQNKHVWDAIAAHIEDTHELRDFAQQAVKFMGHIFILNWAVLFLRDKRRILAHQPSPHEHLLWKYPLVRVGWGGTRRACYKLGDSGFCAKFYKPMEECQPGKMRKRSIRREIGWRRFNKFRNSSSEEVHMYNCLRHLIPTEWRSKLPEVCERVFHPEYGWGVLETFYANPDGTAIIPYEFEIERQSANPTLQRSIYLQARDFLLVLIRSHAYFYEPGNFHVLLDDKGGAVLKLIDFEPESKSALPLEMIIPTLRARKLKRKARRYLSHIRKAYGIEVPIETEIG